MERLLLIGLEPAEFDALRGRLHVPLVSSETLPRVKVERGVLLVERPTAAGQFLPVSHVVFHGIFEHDFDAITALALWGGPSLPDARGMMDQRLRLPGLVRSLAVSRFNTMRRSFVGPGATVTVDRPSVAKWGNWHCGENKERFAGTWTAAEAAVVEDFVEGQAVRVVMATTRRLCRPTPNCWRTPAGSATVSGST